MSAANPPPLPISRSLQALPSEVEFLVSQVRSTLRYLAELGGLEESVYRQIHELLSQGIRPPPTSSSSFSRGMRSDSDSREQDQDKADALGKKNTWVRKVLRESSVLPTTVETALSLAAGPLLNDTQKEAIVQLVELSQQGVADKVTDPSLQRKVGRTTWTGALAAHSSAEKVSKGLQKSVEERDAKKAKKQAEKQQRKQEKDEKRAIRNELKLERQQVIRQRQQQMLNGSEIPFISSAGPAHSKTSGLVENTSSRVTESPASTVAVRKDQQSRLPLPSATSVESSIRHDSSSNSDSSSLYVSSDDNYDEHLAEPGSGRRGARLHMMPPTNARALVPGDLIGDTATLSVLSNHNLGNSALKNADAERVQQLGGTSTAFLIQPGLAISCNVVVMRGPASLHLVGGEHGASNLENASSEAIVSPSARNMPPPPPPSHPDSVQRVQRVGSSTSSTAAQIPQHQKGVDGPPSSSSQVYAPPAYPPPSQHGTPTVPPPKPPKPL